ncbi:hypothetical protein DTO212C5_8681 [Paecilomyces variotii]|nr:hypothetical protein DTO212C5_8681 [Paecilomyces variotii]
MDTNADGYLVASFLRPGSMLRQIAEVRDIRDDWTGVTSTAERKKRQNRLNQRAHRRRQHAQQRHALLTPSESAARGHQLPLDQQQDSRDSENKLAAKDESNLGKGYLLLASPHQRAWIRAFMRKTYEHYSLNSPQPTQLPMLIRLNVLNALSHNATLLGIPVEGLCRDEFISPFSEQGPCSSDAIPPSPSCAANLLPTVLQKTVKHHPWIDLFPIPRMRDNILSAIVAGVFDEDELCGDLLSVEDDGQGEKPALIVWGEPWDPRSWEASDAFLIKWGWLIEGCPEILEATNFWRQRRREKKFIFKMFR